MEEHVFQVAKRVAATGVEMTVLTTDTTGRLPAREWRGGVEVVRVRAWPRRRDYRFAPSLYRAVARPAVWDVVHVQSYHTFVAPIAMLAAARAGIPYVLTFHAGGHSSALRRRARPLQRRLLRPLLARAARLVALAPHEIDGYVRELRLERDRFVLIPNGVDLPRVHDDRAPARGALIASVGRLERYKGHQRILRAMPHVLAARGDARLWIAGTGPHEAKLRRMTSDLGLDDRVEIRAVPGEDRAGMARELSRASLVVLMSEFETHPLAVLEAASLGRPVLVADTPGLSELAAAGLARSVPLDAEPEQLARAVLDQLARPHEPPPLSLPTWDECGRAVLELYRDVAAAG